MDALPVSVSWHEAAYYIEASSIVDIKFGSDLCTVSLNLIYGSVRGAEICETSFCLNCMNFAYLNVSRLDHHSPGSGAIYEAYLHESSPLIDAFLSNRLEGKAGSLVLQSDGLTRHVKHLEIIGEINVNVIFAEIRITTSIPFPPQWRVA